MISITAGNMAARRAKLFRGLAEPSRLSILAAMADGPLSVSEIASSTGLSQPNTSNHLACLLGCGLVARDQEGRFVFYRHADASVSLLLTLVEEVVSGTASNLLECPHCGTAH